MGQKLWSLEKIKAPCKYLSMQQGNFCEIFLTRDNVIAMKEFECNRFDTVVISNSVIFR